MAKEFFDKPVALLPLTKKDYFEIPCEYCKEETTFHNNVVDSSFIGQDGSYACSPCAVRLKWVTMSTGVKTHRTLREWCESLSKAALDKIRRS